MSVKRQTPAAMADVALRPRASVAIGFVSGMMSGLAAKRMEYRALLRDAGISPSLLADPQARVPIDAYAALYNATVRQFDDEGFALFSASLRLGSFEFLCRGMLGSRDLAEALERAARFLRLVLPDMRVTVTREREVAQIEIGERKGLWKKRDDPCRIFAYEWLLRLLHGVSCWLVARELSLGSVRFPYRRPPHAADYSLIYTARSLFRGDTLIATLNPNLLDLPIRRDEAELREFLDGAPGKIALLYRRDRETVHRVRDQIAQTLPAPCSLESVAERLYLSPRTLHRRLQDEGSSFRAIKEALRRDIALSRLEKTRQPVAQIAAELGYSEPSTFFRAFQSWTGMAPTTYRSRLVRSADGA